MRTRAKDYGKNQPPNNTPSSTSNTSKNIPHPPNPFCVTSKSEETDSSVDLFRSAASTMSDMRDKPPHEESYTSLSFLARLPTMVKNGISTLEEGGSNFQEWRSQLLDMVDLVTDTDDYLSSSRPLDKGDRMIRTLVRHSVVPAITSQLDRSLSAKETYDRIVKMFHFPSRTTHLSLWLELTSERLTDLGDVLPYLNKVRSRIDDLDRAGFVWSKDSILGVCYQLGLPTNGDVDFSNVNVVLDARSRNLPDVSVTARETEEAIRAEAHWLTARDTTGMPNIAALHLTNPNLSQRGHAPSAPYRSSDVAAFGTRRHLTSQLTVSQTPPRSQYQPQTAQGTGGRNTTPAPGSAIYSMPKFKHSFHCNGTGHWAADCPLDPNRRSTTARANQADVSSSLTDPDGPLPHDIWTSEGALTDDWETGDAQLDNGATHSVTNEVSWLSNFTTLPTPIPLSVATKAPPAYLTGIGTMMIRSVGGTAVAVKKVYFCREAKGTLISLAALLEAGCNFSFAGDDLMIHSHAGSVKSKYHDRRWMLQKLRKRDINQRSPAIASALSPRREETVANTALSWHRRFGHVSMRVIQRLFNAKAATGLPDKLECAPFSCSDCLLSKSLRAQTLGPSGGSRPQPLELIVCDIAGPFDSSLTGAKYMAVFRDVATTYSEVIVVKNREAVPRVFQDFVARLERQTPYRVKTLRTDGAGEFTSNAFLNWCRSKGIDKDKTMPYEHNQNGIAKRVIRTINDMSRTMRIGAQLPEKFWVFASLAAGYIHNRIPNVNTKDRTPLELLFNKKPHLEGLRVFGEEAFVHIPGERRGKLEPRAQRCIFIGYIQGSKGWRFYNRDTEKIIESSMAVFPSDKPPIPSEPAEARQPTKGDLRHILNALELGKFDAEEALFQQDDLIKQIEQSLATADPMVPKTYAEAMKAPDAAQWQQARLAELGQMQEMEVWQVFDLPDGRKATDAKWVFSRKRDGLYKAQYVARGFTQVHGLDFTETFAPTATFAALRILIIIAARMGWPLYGFDVTAAYLHSLLDHDVWVKQPPGFSLAAPGKVLKWVKALYGTKQAGRCW